MTRLTEKTDEMRASFLNSSPDGSALGTEPGLSPKVGPHLGLRAPLSVLGLRRGLEGCWPLLGHPCPRQAPGSRGLRGRLHLQRVDKRDQRLQPRGARLLEPQASGALWEIPKQRTGRQPRRLWLPGWPWCPRTPRPPRKGQTPGPGWSWAPRWAPAAPPTPWGQSQVQREMR